VNDGSTDSATNRLLADYAKPKTRVITTSNRGLAAARNLAVASTTGRYVCALDADDSLAPTCLEKTVRILDADPSITFVSAWVQLFGEEEWLWKQERCDLPALLAECTVMTAALVRREAVLAVGGYDGAMPAQGDEDWDLWLSIVERGGRGTIIPEALLNYRQRAGSMRRTCSEGEVRLDQIRYIVEKDVDSYRRHLLDVLQWKDVAISDFLRVNRQLERHIETELTPRIAQRRRQLDARRRARELELEAALRVAEVDHTVLREEAAHAHAELEALRGSRSWKLTAPLRVVYAWLRWTRGAA